jgi:hypothetical protein
MELGKEEEAITIEPVEEPVPGEREPAPEEQPVEVPERETVPA